MALWLRALALITEDSDSQHITQQYVLAYNPRESSYRKSNALFWPPQVPGVHMVHTQARTQNTDTHKIHPYKKSTCPLDSKKAYKLRTWSTALTVTSITLNAQYCESGQWGKSGKHVPEREHPVHKEELARENGTEDCGYWTRSSGVSISGTERPRLCIQCSRSLLWLCCFG